VDYGSGNIGSVANMIRRLGHEPLISRNPEDISRASHLILVGVGAFDSGMAQLSRMDLVEPLQRAVKQNGSFLLGVCLGMQLLLDGSDEGSSMGLSLIPGRCRRLSPTEHYKVPNMGWRELIIRNQHPLFNGLERDSRFYFVHSYAAHCNDESSLLATLRVDSTVTAAISDGNVMGVQFHPEKSHRFGLTLYENFCSL
jgi:glutamine amidotransferase